MPDSTFHIPDGSGLRVYSSREVMDLLQIKRSKYFALMRKDSMGIVMLEYGRKGAGGRRIHSEQQVRNCIERMNQLGSQRLKDKREFPKLASGSNGSPGAAGRTSSKSGVSTGANVVEDAVRERGQVGVAA